MENKVNIEALRAKVEVMKQSSHPLMRRIAKQLEKKLQTLENKQNN